MRNLGEQEIKVITLYFDLLKKSVAFFLKEK